MFIVMVLGYMLCVLFCNPPLLMSFLLLPLVLVSVHLHTMFKHSSQISVCLFCFVFQPGFDYLFVLLDLACFMDFGFSLLLYTFVYLFQLPFPVLSCACHTIYKILYIHFYNIKPLFYATSASLVWIRALFPMFLVTLFELWHACHQADGLDTFWAIYNRFETPKPMAFLAAALRKYLFL